MAEVVLHGVFVYTGGDQQVPDEITHAIIDPSVKIVRARAFYGRWQLISVEFHDGVEIIEEEAFTNCISLCGPMKLLGVKIIKEKAFQFCRELTDVEFGDQLETIEQFAFAYTSLKKISMSSVRTIGKRVFDRCDELTDVKFGEGLRTLEGLAFSNCPKLERIALPLKDDMIEDHVFYNCPTLTTIDLVGKIHQTVASLNLESWRNAMNNEINNINQVLPTLRGKSGEAYGTKSIVEERSAKTRFIQWWMGSVIRQLDRYKTEHCKLLKEATTLLELALWKANIDDNIGGEGEREGVRPLAELEGAMAEMRVTSGADVVINNVLPFLVLKPDHVVVVRWGGGEYPLE